MSGKLVLIDGNSIMNRAFYGVPPLTNVDGLHTNAIYGFLNIMFKILDEENADYLSIAFDLKAPTFRHKMYEAYKGTRKGMPDELREQMPLIKELLTKMNVCIVEKEGYEADDILGTLAFVGEREGLDVALISGDRDLLQIATDKIMVRIPKTKGGKTEVENYNTRDVLEKYRLKPYQIIELKALMGDSSDNIPGVPKIGEKTATDLLLQYDNIENLKEHIEEITKKSVKETLRENFDLAILSKKLATICTDVPLDISIKDMPTGDFYTKDAYELLKRLGLKQIIKRFEKCGNFEEKTSVDFVEADLNLFEELMETIKAKEKVGFYFSSNDKECNLSLCFDETTVYLIKPSGFLRLEYICDRFSEIVLNSKETVFITTDFKSQLTYLNESIDIDCSGKFADVSLMAYLINPLLKDYEPVGNKEEYSLYVMKNYEDLECKIKEANLHSLFVEVEMPLVFTLYNMEHEGILVDKEFLVNYSKTLANEIDKLEKTIKDAAGEDFNINSPKQLGVLLFEKMGIEGGKKTKTGYSTSADILEKLAQKYPFVSDVLKYRGLTKLKSTFVDGLFSCIADDNRIHSTFNQTITATGRISSTEPNLQNIPIKLEQGRLVRKAFVPKDGHVFVNADYSQIELRIMAHMSNDAALIKAYNEKADIHRTTASEVFHVPYDEVTSLQRSNAKAVNFGILYGISSFGLSQDLSISVKEAKTYIEKYFESFPRVKEFIDGLVECARQNGYAITLFNRRRPIPELNSSNFMQRSFGERVAMNAPIQGTAADIIKIAMINVTRRLKKDGFKAKLILQIHDELLLEVPVNEQEAVSKLLVEEMENVCKLSCDLVATMNCASNWYDLK